MTKVQTRLLAACDYLGDNTAVKHGKVIAMAIWLGILALVGLFLGVVGIASVMLSSAISQAEE